MSLSVESFRLWAAWLVGQVLWPMLWQSSILIGLVFVLDLMLRRRVRPAVRYGLWLVVLLKLILPPSFSSPTGLAWWLRPAARVSQSAPDTSYTVSYGSTAASLSPAASATSHRRGPTPPLPISAWALLTSFGVSTLLLGFLIFRSVKVARIARRAAPAPEWLHQLLQQVCCNLQAETDASPCRIRVRLTQHAMSPALCGFFRPVLLLPQHVLSELPRNRLRSVLLHELIHLRRGDVWVNCAQTLLQLIYWWHPLLWLANARIRVLREEAVDDAVMLGLREEAPEYAPTLLAVARLALPRPLASLGLVGILESKTTLRRRIQRLVDFQSPRRAGVTLTSMLGLGLFTAMAVPMGQAPGTAPLHPEVAASDDNPWPDPRFQGYAEVKLEADFFSADNSSLSAAFPALLQSTTPVVLSSNQAAELEQSLRQAKAEPAALPLSFAKFSGGTFRWHVGGPTNNLVNYHARQVAGRNMVTGAEIDMPVSRPDWAPLGFVVVPWADGDNLRCDLELGLNDNPATLQQAQAVLPPGGALFWARQLDGFTGRSQLVILRRPAQKTAATASSKPEFTPLVGTQATSPETTTRKALDITALKKFIDLDSKVQDGKLLFEMGKLTEAETTLQQALRLDSKSEAAQYYLSLVEQALRKRTESNKTVPGVAGVANHQVARPESGPPLYTRVFQVDPAAFGQALQAIPDVDGSVALSPLTAVSGSNTLGRLRAFCENLGVKLTPPKAVFYNDEGRLFVRATRQEVDALDEALRTLGLLTNNIQSLAGRQLPSGTNIDATASKVPIFGGDIPILGRLFQTNAASSNTNGAQMQIKSSFISLPASSMAHLQRILGSAHAGGTNALLSPPQTAVLLKALQADGEVELLGQASLTTLSGRQAQISIEPALPEAEKTTSEKAPNPVLYLDIIPTTQQVPGGLLQLTGTASTGPSSVSPSQIHFNTAIPNGHTLVLFDPSAIPGSDAPTPTKHLLVLITPTLIDATGNPIHN